MLTEAVAITMRVYRVWGGLAQKVGSRMTVNRPRDTEEARERLGLPPENLALWLTEVELPDETRLELIEEEEVNGEGQSWVIVECVDPLPDECFGMTTGLGDFVAGESD